MSWRSAASSVVAATVTAAAVVVTAARRTPGRLAIARSVAARSVDCSPCSGAGSVGTHPAMARANKAAHPQSREPLNGGRCGLRIERRDATIAVLNTRRDAPAIPGTAMNAARIVVGLLTRVDVRSVYRRALRLGKRTDAELAITLDREQASAALAELFASDLAGLLNVLARDELAQLAATVPQATVTLRQAVSASVAELRASLWQWGAIIEAGSDAWIGTALQPMPHVLAGHLVHHRPALGLFPACAMLPRAIAPAIAAAPPSAEPATVEQLLEAADALIGVRLGQRGVDKGAWGQRAAALLGVVDRGDDEPDWRGDVEIKTVPVQRDGNGWWRIAEDPAICMAAGRPMAKLARVLWLVRATLEDGDATILSWYFLECDAFVARLAQRDLHQRPKGPRGTDQRGWYLHKRFFADAGLLATLNGSGVRMAP